MWTVQLLWKKELIFLQSIATFMIKCSNGQRGWQHIVIYTNFNRAMDGNVKFEEALEARLDLIKPSRLAIQECLELYPPQLSPGIEGVVKDLHTRKCTVGLISGGFRSMIRPVAERLKIEHVFANRILFDKNGEYDGFHTMEFTSRDGGKALAMQR